MKNWQYYKVRKERNAYLGVRYFKFNYNEDKCVQVCLFTGDVKKGKSNTFGVYLISKLTLFSNYLATNYIEACTKKQYDDAFNKVVKMLK